MVKFLRNGNGDRHDIPYLSDSTHQHLLARAGRGGVWHNSLGCKVGQNLRRPERLTVTAAQLPSGDYCENRKCKTIVESASRAHSLWAEAAELVDRAHAGWDEADVLTAAASQLANIRAGVPATDPPSTFAAWRQDTVDAWLERAATLGAGDPAAAAIAVAASLEVHPDRRHDTGGPWKAVEVAHTAWASSRPKGATVAAEAALAVRSPGNPADKRTVARWVARWEREVSRIADAAGTGWAVITVDTANFGSPLPRLLATDPRTNWPRAFRAVPAIVADHLTCQVVHRCDTADDAAAVARAASELNQTAYPSSDEVIAVAVRLAA